MVLILSTEYVENFHTYSVEKNNRLKGRKINEIESVGKKGENKVDQSKNSASFCAP